MQIGIFGLAEKFFSGLLLIHQNISTPLQHIHTCTEQNLKPFDIVIFMVGSRVVPTEHLDIIRSFVSEGGSVIILHKKGGDVINNTQWNLLIEGVIPRSDMLFSAVNPHHQPRERIRWEHLESSYDDTIIYDGGCTFDVSLLIA